MLLPENERIEIADKWLKALRSGDYKQTRGHLKDSRGYCCLGVLCDASHKGQWDGDTYELPQPSPLADEFLGTGVLPGELAKQLGMTIGDQRQLYGLNDTQGKRFSEIADYVESNKTQLFKLKGDVA